VRHHLSRPVALAAGLSTALALCAAAGASTARASSTPAAVTARVAGPAAAPAGPAATSSLFLIDGVRAQLAQGPGVCSFSLDVGGSPAAGSTLASIGEQTQTMTVGGQTYLLPVTAVPYLGRGLDASLFDLATLRTLEAGGRLPVQLAYNGALPALPGITVTSSGDGMAHGYLTLAGARTFGAALTRQFLADHAGGGYGQGGLFGHGLSIGPAGATAPTARTGTSRTATQPGYQMHTLTVTGTNEAGKPDTGDEIYVLNLDNTGRTGNFDSDVNYFYRGVAKFSLPVGHYWAIGDFFDVDQKARTFSERLDVLPQFTVSGNAALKVAEQAASSELSFGTARPSSLQGANLELNRTTANHGDDLFEWSSLTLNPKVAPPALYASPVATPISVGTLTSETSAQLAAPASAPGTPYSYAVAYQAHGSIPVQHFTVNQAGLATQDARFYSAKPGAAAVATAAMFTGDYSALCSGNTLFQQKLAAQRIYYLSTAPGLSWQENYIPDGPGFGSGGQVSQPRSFLPGQHVTTDWNDYPLHPAARSRIGNPPGAPPSFPSATRAGNTLQLYLAAFSDSTPGHSGQGIYPPYSRSASYELDQNGTEVAGGPVKNFYGVFATTAKLKPSRSTIKFTLNTAQSAKLSPLSTATSTTWTWRSAHESGSALPASWACNYTRSGYTRACRAEPLLTLAYNVSGESLTGSTQAGQQVVRLSVAHLEPSHGTAVTGAHLSASFDGGKTWHAATMTGRAGNWSAVFSAPAGAQVTLRTTATDAAGGTISETITGAYQVAAASSGATAHTAAATPARARAACPPAGPRQARCFAVYAPQTAVDAALAARAAGQHVAPGATTPQGWNAKDIESAYKLPVTKGQGQTVALVDAFSTPHLASDLATYRKQFGLPPCTTASGCLRIVNQQGKTSPLPPADPFGWGVEETLDVSMVSAACPQCRILVVEARQPSYADLAAAEDTAARLGAQVISNSYGGRESGFTQASARAYEHPGHTIVASSGDEGYGAADFPANLADVTAVGGTTLARAKNARGWTETVWNAGFDAAASGCSAYVAKPSWQHDPHCPGRTVADVSALADNVPIYDSSISRQLGGPWLTVAGTSAASPLVAGVYALAGNAATVAPGYEYRHASALFDVTRGTNTTAGTTCGGDYLCVAKPGYDGPTGLGTPDGTGAF